MIQSPMISAKTQMTIMNIEFHIMAQSIQGNIMLMIVQLCAMTCGRMVVESLWLQWPVAAGCGKPVAA